MASIGCAPRVRTELESIVGLKQLAEDGGLYTILPRGEMMEELATGRLAKLGIVDPPVAPHIVRRLVERAAVHPADECGACDRQTRDRRHHRKRLLGNHVPRNAVRVG